MRGVNGRHVSCRLVIIADRRSQMCDLCVILASKSGVDSHSHMWIDWWSKCTKYNHLYISGSSRSTKACRNRIDALVMVDWLRPVRTTNLSGKQTKKKQKMWRRRKCGACVGGLHSTCTRAENLERGRSRKDAIATGTLLQPHHPFHSPVSLCISVCPHRVVRPTRWAATPLTRPPFIHYSRQKKNSPVIWSSPSSKFLLLHFRTISSFFSNSDEVRSNMIS
jgi:ferredoxin